MDAKISKIKKDVLNASYAAGACHIGSALSCVSILVPLLYSKKDEDIFIFGKASGVATFYAILADQGLFRKENLPLFLKRYPLPSKVVPGVIHSVGSMGHGLSVAAGLAYADRTRNVYVLLSDGECQEGSTYEACLFAGQHDLTNLHVIVDNNGLQAGGRTCDILNLTDTFEFMCKALPNCQVVKTVKGDGVARFENDYTWHYKNLDDKILKEALEDIDDPQKYEKRRKFYDKKGVSTL